MIAATCQAEPTRADIYAPSLASVASASLRLRVAEAADRHAARRYLLLRGRAGDRPVAEAFVAATGSARDELADARAALGQALRGSLQLRLGCGRL